MSLRHRQPFTCRFPEELRVEMEVWTRANDSSQAELVRRAVREFLDRRPLKELGINIDSLALSARTAKQLKRLDL